MSRDAESLLRFVDEFTISSGTPMRASPSPHQPLQTRTNNDAQTPGTDHSDKEQVRQWAQRMRAAVEAWAKQQRALIDLERKQAVEQQTAYRSAMAGIGQERKRWKQQVADAERRYSELEAQVVEIVDNQWRTERRFRDVIDYQRERIRQLEAQIAGQECAQVLRLATDAKDQTPPQQSPPEPANDEEAKTVHPTPAVDTPTVAQKPTLRPSTVKTERRRELLEDGTLLTYYSNGTVRENHNDCSVVIRFANGDIQTRSPDGAVAYFFAETRVTKLSEPEEASTLFRFPNGQVERHWPDGRKRIQFPDGRTHDIPAQPLAGSHPNDVFRPRSD